MSPMCDTGAFEHDEAMLCEHREKWCTSRDDCFEILQEKLYSLFTKSKLQYLHYKHYKHMPQCSCRCRQPRSS